MRAFLASFWSLLTSLTSAAENFALAVEEVGTLAHQSASDLRKEEAIHSAIRRAELAATIASLGLEETDMQPPSKPVRTAGLKLPQPKTT